MAKVIGQFQAVKGKVTLVNAQGKEIPARFGMQVKEGDSVVTDAQGQAKVVMLDQNVISVSPDTRMKFGKYQQKIEKTEETVLDVVYGKVRANVKQKYDEDKTKFRVQTKAAVAGVRGTNFVCSYDAQTGQIICTTFEGAVEVGLLGPDGNLEYSSLVGEGQSTSFILGELPAGAVLLSADELRRRNSESNVEGGGDQYDPSLPGERDENEGDGDGNAGGSGDDSFGDDTEIAKDDLQKIEERLEKDIYDDIDLNVKVDDIPNMKEFCEFCRETVENATTNLFININLQD